MLEKTIIFSDGSSRGNPGPGGWGAVISENGNVIELGGGEKHTTNNKMELLGAINALQKIKDDTKEIIVYTDSSYVIHGITKWVYGWQKNNWMTSQKESVSNQDLWKLLIKASKGKKITWAHVAGHAGVEGNERCDVIATSYADGEKINLFKGKLSDYEYDLSDTVGNSVKVLKKSKNKSLAYSYLSLVNGKFTIDKTWAECEKRVKGVKGHVKFKKAISPEDENEIMKEWGIK